MACGFIEIGYIKEYDWLLQGCGHQCINWNWLLLRCGHQ